MATEISITDLQRDTGETVRQLQYWSDLGVFRPLRSTNKRGRGVQRLFRADPPLYGERTWALVASELNRWRLPIGVTKDIIDTMRVMWAGPEKEPPAGWAKVLKNNPIARALAGEHVVVLIALKEGEPPLIARLDVERPAEPPTVEAEFEKDFLGESQTEDWQLYAKRAVQLSDEFLADFSSGHILNFTRVLRPLAGKASGSDQ